MRTILSTLALALGASAFFAPPAPGQEAAKDLRLLGLSTELIVETGSRTAACDVLTFSPDGKFLFAAGDDKAVRVWPFDDRTGGLNADEVQALRWATYREQRGSIYAMALDRQAGRVAVAGYGVRQGSVAVLDRDGNVKHGVDAAATGPLAPVTVWAMAFAPSGRRLVYGGGDGSVWAWEPGAGKPLRLGVHPGRDGGTFNPVRLVVFTGENEVLTVAADGWACGWDARRPSAADKRFRFDVINMAAAAVDPRKRWVAAVGQDRNARLVEVRSVATGRGKRMWVPEGSDRNNYPRCVAFDARAERLAVGYYSIPKGAPFYKIVGGGVALFDLTRNEPRPSQGPPSTHYPEALAFHPGGQYLAVAGGENHEVTVWDLDRMQAPLSRIAGPGHTLWGVGLSPDRRFLGFLDRRQKDPPAPNRRGQGAWRVFDLEKRTWAEENHRKAFAPTPPRETAVGWSVVPDRTDAHVWSVRHTGGKTFKLPLDRDRDKMPRCYTFLGGGDDPVRLAVGHYWGASVFELRDDGPKLVRKFVGHQGEVMALAPSANGDLLVTAGRDQTVACWRLTPWLFHGELGARVVAEDGPPVVQDVAPGSPAWEAKLLKGDEVVTLVVDRTEMVYNREAFELLGRDHPPRGTPADALKAIRDLVPGKELYFRVRRAGEKKILDLLTTVRQRPVWRFFPTQDNEWVLWRYHDFHYDTSTNGDSFVGWQLSGDVTARPVFDKAEQLRERFHNPEKVAEIVKGLADPERVSVVDLQPPRVSVRASQKRVTDGDVSVVVIAETAGDKDAHHLGEVALWVNDYKVDEWKATDPKRFRREVTIPNRVLRRGTNVITAQGFNKVRARRDAEDEVECGRPARKPNLYLLAAGVGDYQADYLSKLAASVDADGVSAAWGKQAGKFYGRIVPDVLKDRQVTPEAVLAALRRVGRQAGPDDVLLLFIGGHGTSDKDIPAALKSPSVIKSLVARQRKVELLEPPPENTFVFCTFNFDVQRPLATGLTSEAIYKALAGVACRKVVMLDTCHSGTLSRDPVRTLAPEAMGPVIFSACSPKQLANESKILGLVYTQGKVQGLFSIALVLALGREFDDADRNKDGNLDASELDRHIRQRVVDMMENIPSEDGEARLQQPTTFLPQREKRLGLASK